MNRKICGANKSSSPTASKPIIAQTAGPTHAGAGSTGCPGTGSPIALSPATQDTTKPTPRNPIPIPVVHRLQRGRERTHERPFHDQRPSGVVAATHVEPFHHQRRSGERPDLTARTSQLSGDTVADVYWSGSNVTTGSHHGCVTVGGWLSPFRARCDGADRRVVRLNRWTAGRGPAMLGW